MLDCGSRYLAAILTAIARDGRDRGLKLETSVLEFSYRNLNIPVYISVGGYSERSGLRGIRPDMIDLRLP